MYLSFEGWGQACSLHSHVFPTQNYFEEIFKPYGSLRKLDVLSNGMVLVDSPFVIVIVPRGSGHVV